MSASFLDDVEIHIDTWRQMVTREIELTEMLISAYGHTMAKETLHRARDFHARLCGVKRTIDAGIHPDGLNWIDLRNEVWAFRTSIVGF